MNKDKELNNEKSNFLNNEILSSSFSHESSLYEDNNDEKSKQNKNYDEFELDSRQELVFHSIGTGSDNSYINEMPQDKLKKFNASKKSSTNTNVKSDKGSQKTNKNSEYALLYKQNEKEKMNQKDETIRGNRSTTYNPQAADSLSTLSDKKKKVIVRVVTVFSIIFFLICFAMIAFTLRMSEKIDAQSNFIIQPLY